MKSSKHFIRSWTVMSLLGRFSSTTFSSWSKFPFWLPLAAIVVGNWSIVCGQTVNLGPIPPGDRTVRAVPFGTIPAGERMAYMYHAGDASGRVYLAIHGGRVYEFDAAGNRSAMPYLDVSAARAGDFKHTANSSGIRGFAFHPDFSQPGTDGYRKFYTSHSENFNTAPADFPVQPGWENGSFLDSVLAEWELDPNTGRIDPNSFRDVLRVQMPNQGHPMQQIAFDPTASRGSLEFGNLYVAIADGAGSCNSGPCIDTNNTGQDTSNVHSTVLRINPLANGNNEYTIPPDNPFLVPGDGVLDEIFAYGFRNPMTLTFDTLSGQILLGDISQNNIEEINLIEAGRNYGWGQQPGGPDANREGTYVINQPETNHNDLSEVPLAMRVADPYTYPAAQYDHFVNPSGGGEAVAGGFVYRGQSAVELEGVYLFGNFTTDHIFYSLLDDLSNDQVPADLFQLQLEDQNGNPTSYASLVGSSRTDVRFGQDENGDIYLLNKVNGVVYRLEGTVGTPDRSWHVDSSGDWNVNNHWNPSAAPNSSDHIATFGGVITAPRVIFTESDVTVARINFNSDPTYAVVGTGIVNLDGGVSASGIEVLLGDHQFQAEVNLHTDTEAVIALGTSLTFNNTLNLGGNTLTKSGAGSLGIRNSLVTGGGTVDVQQGTIFGNGTVGGDVINSGGMISPGDALSLSSVPEPSTWLKLVAGILTVAASWQIVGRTREP